MIGDSLLLLKQQKSYDLYGAMPFSTKMHDSCSKIYKIKYKATVMVFFIIALTVHKYEESNVDLKGTKQETLHAMNVKELTQTNYFER